VNRTELTVNRFLNVNFLSISAIAFFLAVAATMFTVLTPAFNALFPKSFVASCIELKTSIDFLLR
jgi:hypothetical protein